MQIRICQYIYNRDKDQFYSLPTTEAPVNCRFIVYQPQRPLYLLYKIHFTLLLITDNTQDQYQFIFFAKQRQITNIQYACILSNKSTFNNKYRFLNVSTPGLRFLYILILDKELKLEVLDKEQEYLPLIIRFVLWAYDNICLNNMLDILLQQFYQLGKQK